MLNKVIIDGFLVGNTETNENLFRYYPGKDDKKSVLRFLLSIVNPYSKPDDKGRRESSLMQFKAFGATADFIAKNFKSRDAMVIEGKIIVEKGGEKEDGGKYPDQTVIIVDSANHPIRNGANSEKEETAAPAPKAEKKAEDNGEIGMLTDFFNI